MPVACCYSSTAESVDSDVDRNALRQFIEGGIGAIAGGQPIDEDIPFDPPALLKLIERRMNEPNPDPDKLTRIALVLACTFARRADWSTAKATQQVLAAWAQTAILAHPPGCCNVA